MEIKTSSLEYMLGSALRRVYVLINGYWLKINYDKTIIIHRDKEYLFVCQNRTYNWKI